MILKPNIQPVQHQGGVGALNGTRLKFGSLPGTHCSRTNYTAISLKVQFSIKSMNLSSVSQWVCVVPRTKGDGVAPLFHFIVKRVIRGTSIDRGLFFLCFVVLGFSVFVF